MRLAVFSTKPYDRDFLTAANQRTGSVHELSFYDAHLGRSSAGLAQGFTAICPFVNDQLDREVLRQLASGGTRLIAMRSAGFNNVDLPAAQSLGLTVAHVPAYSPAAVAEHAAALVLSLNRKIHRAFSRVREGNFLLDGLLGFDLQGRTVGVIGTGRIGLAFGRIMRGFGCRLLGSDPVERPAFREIGGSYVPLGDLLADSDIISLHCPLNPETRHLIGEEAIGGMKRGVMLINTSRGAVVDTRALIAGLKTGAIGYLGIDVYEEEADLFFEDLSNQVIQDDVFARLLTFPNVLVTAHQGFFTREALTAIAETTIENVTAFERTGAPVHAVTPEQHFCAKVGPSGRISSDTGR